MGLTELVAPRGTRRRQWAGTMVKALRSAGRASGLVGENDTLKRSWAKHDPAALEEYLVNGYQNPRINAQSMLMRDALVRELFGSEFDPLMDEELQHCVRATKALQKRAAELDVKMRSYLDPGKRAQVKEVSEVISGWEDTYEKRWSKELQGRTAGPLRVLEFACGSANDYRFTDSYGIGQFLDYTGVDLNDANVSNARRMFPDVDFQVGSVLDLPFADRSFDYVIASDIFEHLSIEAMEQAMHQAMRLARKSIVITFFSMSDIPEHTVKPVRNYHWNRLSASKVQQMIEAEFGPVEAIRVRDLMVKEYGFKDSYNANAWTFIARREGTA
jgi:ubiquinone/menaquinone biosynthesis C-methylase UbiE